MTAYVTFGGMLATTWVQIIKACMLLAGATFMAFMVLWHFGFSPEAMFKAATEINPKGLAIMSPGSLVTDPISAISLGLALMFGTAGLPHILMRFFTVADAKAARKSVFYATGFIGYFYILTFIIGFGAITLVMTDPAFYTTVVGADGAVTYDKVKDLIGGTNMAAIHLSEAVGGNLFLGFISAVAFATILAVVAGLTLAGASAVSHDLYASVFAKGRATDAQEIRVSKIATVVLGIIAIYLGYVFEQQNVAFMVGLAFAIAASCNFPVLLMSMFWKGLTTRGALIGGLLGPDLGRGPGRPGPDRVGEGAAPSGRLGAVPLREPGAVLDDHRLRRHLAVLGPRPQPDRRRRGRGLRIAVHPIRDRSGRRRCLGALNVCRSTRRRMIDVNTGRRERRSYPITAACSTEQNRQGPFARLRDAHRV